MENAGLRARRLAAWRSFIYKERPCHPFWGTGTLSDCLSVGDEEHVKTMEYGHV